jgi:hypothetical protein
MQALKYRNQIKEKRVAFVPKVRLHGDGIFRLEDVTLGTVVEDDDALQRAGEAGEVLDVESLDNRSRRAVKPVCDQLLGI